MDGLIIKPKPLSLILQGKKTWELRGMRTHKRGRIALIRSGSGLVVGTCLLVDCIGPLDNDTFTKTLTLHHSSHTEPPYANTYAWVLDDVRVFAVPKPYVHPQGAIIWVCLNEISEE